MVKKTKSEADINTDPYCPPVGKTAPKDPPFVIERRDELPSGRKQFGLAYAQKKKGVKTHMKIPARTCQSFTKATVKRTGYWASHDPEHGSKTLRTAYLRCHNGIVEVDHQSRAGNEIRWIGGMLRAVTPPKIYTFGHASCEYKVTRHGRGSHLDGQNLRTIIGLFKCLLIDWSSDLGSEP